MPDDQQLLFEARKFLVTCFVALSVLALRVKVACCEAGQKRQVRDGIHACRQHNFLNNLMGLFEQALVLIISFRLFGFERFLLADQLVNLSKVSLFLLRNQFPETFDFLV